MGDGVVIYVETNGVVTHYTYGLEFISAQAGKTRTEYVYDGLGIKELQEHGTLTATEFE